MKQKLTLFLLALFMSIGVWAEITVSPSTGVYWKNGAVSSDAWAPIWKSTQLAADGSTPLLTLEAGTGMDTANGDIYASTYTLTVATGYTISSYSLDGTAAGGDVTVTPAGGVGKTMTNGSSFDAPLTIMVNAQTATFVLTGAGHISNLALSVVINPTIASGGATLPSAYGSFGGQTYTTSDASGLAGVTVTASSGLTIGDQTVNVTGYGKCFKLVTSAASTNYTVTLTAPSGYVITGYYMGGSANSKDYAHTITPAGWAEGVVVSSPPYNTTYNAPEPIEVTGLNTNSTSFTISTANGGNTLYLPTFKIYVVKGTAVNNVTYHVMFNGSNVANTTVAASAVGSAAFLPSSLQKPFCTYEYYSDAACTTPLSTLTAGTTDVYAKCTFSAFTASTSFNTATWYYLKLKDSNYTTYVSGATPNVTLPASNAGDRTAQWAFFGDPYNGFLLKNRAAGNDLVLGSATAASDGNNGGNTYATLQTSGSQTYERWFPGNSTYYSSTGFYLNNAQNHALNQRSTANLAYWTGGKDAGSTFRVESAPSDAEALAALCASHVIASGNLDKPGFPTTAAYTTFRNTIEAFASLEQWEEGIATAVSTLNASVVYPNGTYYIKNRNTGCYAFITDDGELVPRIKIDNTTPHANNNYLWEVTSDKSKGTCSIVSSLYDNVPFAKGDGTYSNITAGNRTVITTLSTSIFSGNNGNSGGFYLGGAHNNNTYTSAGNGNSHVISWNSEESQGSQWIFEPVDLGTEWTVTVEGLEEGGQDAVTLSDGTIVNLGTGTVYLSDAPTTSNITQGDITGYTIQDGSIAINGEGHTITITYSPSYDVLIANYITDNNVGANVANAGQLGYPAANNEYAMALAGVMTAYNGGTYTGNETNYNNLRTWYEGYKAAAVITPTTGFYRIRSILGANAYLKSVEPKNRMTVTTTADKETIFCLDAGNHLVSYTKGVAVNNVRELGDVGVTGNTFAFVKALSGNLGQFSIKCNDGGSYNNNYLYSTGVDGSEADRNTLSTSWYNQNSFTVEPVESLPVTIGSTTYATLFAPVALTIPSRVQAYYVSNLTETEATLTEIATTIPAGTPVVLKADAAGTYDFAITTGGTDVSASNKLAGQAPAFAVSADDVNNKTYYTLQQNATHTAVGFYPKTAEGSIAGFKAYLPAANFPSAGVKGLAFIFDDEATGINNLNANLNANEAIYNIAGQKLQKMQRGINIVNGKKIIK